MRIAVSMWGRGLTGELNYSIVMYLRSAKCERGAESEGRVPGAESLSEREGAVGRAFCSDIALAPPPPWEWGPA